MNLTVVCLLAVLGAGMAQPAPDAATPAPEPAVEVDPELQALTEVFRNLYDSLRALGGVSAADHELIGTLRERVAAYNKARPRSPRGLALELQLSQWLQDDPRIYELFGRLTEATDDVQIGLAWARHYERVDDGALGPPLRTGR
ncbi:MAG: hypothetical protein ACYSU7_05575 [Planctomycetota bacterium]|jgi:hypothetical protein